MLTSNPLHPQYEVGEDEDDDVLTSPNNIALIVPSIRGESFSRFVAEWRPTGLLDRVDLILLEDNPTRTFTPSMTDVAEHLCWEDIDQHDWSWIIPRRSDTVRSYAYWWAWKRGYSVIQTMDDDCYPARGYENLDEQHLEMLVNRTRWFNTLNSVRPRGVPYKNIGQRPIYLNHGIWQGVLDYDAPQQLVNPIPEIYSHDNRIVPAGAYFPMCGMNVMWRREATVLMYHLLMGKWMVGDGDTPVPLPFDRFGDIWCGILMKRVADHLGWGVSTGTPYIHHDRASDPFTNLRKEANGIQINEKFWEWVDAIPLTGTDAVTCYAQLGLGVAQFGGEHASYWSSLGDAMVTWAELFAE